MRGSKTLSSVPKVSRVLESDMSLKTPEAGQARSGGGGVAEFFAEIVWEIYMGLCAKMSNKSARSKACVANNVASYTGSKPNLAQNSPENTLIDPA